MRKAEECINKLIADSQGNDRVFFKGRQGSIGVKLTTDFEKKYPDINWQKAGWSGDVYAAGKIETSVDMACGRLDHSLANIEFSETERQESFIREKFDQKITGIKTGRDNTPAVTIDKYKNALNAGFYSKLYSCLNNVTQNLRNYIEKDASVAAFVQASLIGKGNQDKLRQNFIKQQSRKKYGMLSYALASGARKKEMADNCHVDGLIEQIDYAKNNPLFAPYIDCLKKCKPAECATVLKQIRFSVIEQQVKYSSIEKENLNAIGMTDTYNKDYVVKHALHDMVIQQVGEMKKQDKIAEIAVQRAPLQEMVAQNKAALQQQRKERQQNDEGSQLSGAVEADIIADAQRVQERLDKLRSKGQDDIGATVGTILKVTEGKSEKYVAGVVKKSVPDNDAVNKIVKAKIASRSTRK